MDGDGFEVRRAEKGDASNASFQVPHYARTVVGRRHRRHVAVEQDDVVHCGSMLLHGRLQSDDVKISNVPQSHVPFWTAAYDAARVLHTPHRRDSIVRVGGDKERLARVHVMRSNFTVVPTTDDDFIIRTRHKTQT